MGDMALTYLYEAAKHGSMKAASEHLSVAVSSISRQIARLERGYGVPLIEHGRRTIRLTEAGRVMVEYYLGGLAARDVMLEDIRNLRGVNGGTIVVAVGEAFLSDPLTRFVVKFQTQHPNVKINVVVAPTKEIIQKVTDDESHVGLVFNTSLEPKISVRASISQPLCILSRPDHPITTRTEITLSDLNGYKLCLMPRGYRVRSVLESAEEKYGVCLESQFVTNSMYMTRQLAKDADAITILPPIAALEDIRSGALVATPIAMPDLERTTVSVICRNGRQLYGAPLLFCSTLDAHLKQWIV